MVKSESNASEASLNLLEKAPLHLLREQTEITFGKQIVIEETTAENKTSVETSLTTYYSRIKKRMRNRSSNIL